MTAQLAEPPWYGPVCPVVWEGWHREVSPYPDQSALAYVSRREGRFNRALNLASKIRMRLGGQPGMASPFPENAADNRGDLLEFSAKYERIVGDIEAAIRLGASGYPHGEVLPVARDCPVSQSAGGFPERL